MRFIATALVVATFIAVVSAAALTAEECRSKGFHSVDLECSTCASLRESLGSEGSAVADECQQCCTTTAGGGDAKKYHSAKLVITKGSAGSSMLLGQFLRDNKDKLTAKHRFTVEYRPYTVPHLVLRPPPLKERRLMTEAQLAALATEEEVVTIDEWRGDAIYNFLRAKLVEL